MHTFKIIQDFAKSYNYRIKIYINKKHFTWLIPSQEMFFQYNQFPWVQPDLANPKFIDKLLTLTNFL